jgi:predicted regulator of Ras-like GTPase activity (Roadblock/LC7/MglB family)
MTASAAEFPQQWTATTDTQLTWLLDDMVSRVPHLQQAALLSRDGLIAGASAGLGRDDAEHLAALAAGLASLASGGCSYFGIGRVQQTVIEASGGFLFVTAAGAGSCLAVLAAPEADVGLLGYEMAVLVKRAGRHMGIGRRPADDGD